MSRLHKLRGRARVIFPAVVSAVFVISATLRGNSYLSSIGPPSLRFESPQTHRSLVPTEYSFADSLPVKVEKAVIPQPATVPTHPVVDNAVKIFPASTNSATSQIVVASTDSTQPAATSDQANPAPNMGDMTIVTPEMLVDYLKPAPGGTRNAAQTGVVLPGKLGFTPPATVAAPSSQAIYKKE